jgi:hypothetical protein
MALLRLGIENKNGMSLVGRSVSRTFPNDSLKSFRLMSGNRIEITFTNKYDAEDSFKGIDERLIKSCSITENDQGVIVKLALGEGEVIVDFKN